MTRSCEVGNAIDTGGYFEVMTTVVANDLGLKTPSCGIT